MPESIENEIKKQNEAILRIEAYCENANRDIAQLKKILEDKIKAQADDEFKIIYHVGILIIVILLISGIIYIIINN